MSEEEEIIDKLKNHTDYNSYEDYEKVLKLIDLYNKEKEKNKELEENLKMATAMLTKGTYPEQNEGDNDFCKQFIPKSKVKDMIEECIREADEEGMDFDAGTILERLEIKLLKEGE